jgi:NAD(P)H dehydrogenase (quinone)
VVTLNDLEWADAIIFSVSTRYGNMPSQMKQFLDTIGGHWFNGKLVNKVVTAMSLAQNSHCGNPYGTSVTVNQEGKMIEDVEAAVKHQAKRTVTVAEWVKKANQ